MEQARDVTGIEAGIATEEESMRFAGIDVGKTNHFVAVVDETQQVIVKSRQFSEDATGYERVVKALGGSEDLLVVMEATGHYWRNLYARLTGAGFQVSVVNAMVPARFAKMELRRAKTDSMDAVGLARFAAAMRPKPTPPPEALMRELKDLSRWRARCVQDFGDKVRQLHRQMDQAFPEIGQVLKSLDTQRATTLLKRYPSAKVMARARLTTLANLVCDGRHRLGSEAAEKLSTLARASVGSAGASAETIVVMLCEDLDRLRDRLKKLDAQLDKLALQHELTPLLTSIPGVGVTTAVRILGEVGDPTQFKSGAALAAYVGVVPATSHSGSRAPESAPICPVGHARLRHALWMPTMTAVKVNPWLRTFYERLVARGKKPKAAMVAAMNKLLQAVWRIAKERRPFELRTTPTPP